MRIKSNFKDYYDGLQRTDQEIEPLYLRKQSMVKVASLPIGVDYKNLIDASPFILGLCDKIYPILRISKPNPDNALKPLYTHCYSIEDYDSELKSRLSKRDFNFWMGDDNRRRAGLNRKVVAAWFSDPWSTEQYRYYKGDKTPLEFCSNYKTPVWLGPVYNSKEKGQYITLNPYLSEIGLARIIPPWQAYQDIRVWLSNQAWPNKPIPNVSDADLLIAKGFDPKTSFRKQPRS